MKQVQAHQPNTLLAPDVTLTTQVTATVDVPIVGGEGNDLRPQIKEWLTRHLEDAHVPIRLASFDIVDVSYNSATVSVTYIGVEEDVMEYIQQQLGAPITSVGSKKIAGTLSREDVQKWPTFQLKKELKDLRDIHSTGVMGRRDLILRDWIEEELEKRERTSSKKSWRQSLGALETPHKGFTPYKGKTQTLPSRAEFKKDLFPTKGDSAKKEIDAYKEGNSLMESDKKNEDTVKAGSSLMLEKVKRYDVLKHNKEDQVLPKYASKKSWHKKLAFGDAPPIVKCPSCGYVDHERKFLPGNGKYIDLGETKDYYCPNCDFEFPQNADSTYPHQEDDMLFSSKHSFIEKEDTGYMVKSESGKNLRKHPTTKEKAIKQLQAMEINKHKEASWRQKLADVSFQNRPDGTIKIDITSHPNEPLAQNPNTLQPQPPGPAEVQKTEGETGKVNEASKKADLYDAPRQDASSANNAAYDNARSQVGGDSGIDADFKPSYNAVGEEVGYHGRSGIIHSPELNGMVEVKFHDTGSVENIDADELRSQDFGLYSRLKKKFNLKKSAKPSWRSTLHKEALSLENTDYYALAQEYGVIYRGIQKALHPSFPDMPMFEDPTTHSTFVKRPDESLAHAIARSQLSFSQYPKKATQVSQEVKMPAKEFFDEHKHLIPTLEHGSQEARNEEAQEQTQEVEDWRKKLKTQAQSLAPMDWPYYTLDASGHLVDDHGQVNWPEKTFTSSEEAERFLIENDERGNVRSSSFKKRAWEVNPWNTEEWVDVEGLMLPKDFKEWKENHEGNDHIGIEYAEVTNESDPPGMVRFKIWIKNESYLPYSKDLEQTYHAAIASLQPELTTSVKPVVARVNNTALGADTQRTHEKDASPTQSVCSANNDNPIKSWVIRKEGNLELIGKECKTHAGIFLEASGKPLESIKLEKGQNNLEWRELISEAEWVAKFEDMLHKQSSLDSLYKATYVVGTPDHNCSKCQFFAPHDLGSSMTGETPEDLRTGVCSYHRQTVVGNMVCNDFKRVTNEIKEPSVVSPNVG
jgi:hypothetical protein